jgi:hypothetical protein
MDNFLYVWDRMHRIATRLEQIEERVQKIEKPVQYIETTAENFARRNVEYRIQPNWNRRQLNAR